VYAITTPLRSLYKLDRQSQLSRQGCHCLQLQDQPFVLEDVLVLLATSELAQLVSRGDPLVVRDVRPGEPRNISKCYSIPVLAQIFLENHPIF